MRAVVIGTGAGGLAAAAMLARDGFDVVAVERAKQLGGYINPFARRHYEFDPGVHYLGEAYPGGSLHRTLGKLGVDPDALLAPMDFEFDRLRFPGFEFRIPGSPEAYRQRLTETFPDEKQGIDRFFATLDALDAVADKGGEIAATGVRLEHARLLPDALRLGRWARASFRSFLDWAFDGPEIKAVVAGQSGDYGLPPSRASALYALALIRHYLHGAVFPRGGSRGLRDALVDRGKEAGASYRRFTAVTKINVEAGRAVGVTTESGERIDADVVISAVDPAVTFGELIAPDHLPARLRKRIRRLVPSVGSFSVFLGLKRDLREHGLGAFNVWDYATWDLEEAYAPMAAGTIPDEMMFFLSPNSLKDPSGTLAPEGCSTLEVVTLLPFAPFRQWADGRSLMRPAEYNELKEHVAERLLADVEARHPGLVGDVEVREVATPASNVYYTAAIAGGAYGPAATPDQSILFRFPTRTPIPNVFIAGAGVLGGGVSPALQSGVLAAKLARKSLRR